MPLLVNKTTGEKKFFVASDTQSAVATGEWLAQEGEIISLIGEDGERFTAPVANLESISRYSGAQVLAPEQIAVDREDRVFDELYGDGVINTGRAFLEGALRGRSVGTSDPLLLALGADREGLAERRARNEIAATIGEVVGAFFPFFPIGGATAAATGGSVLGRMLARTPAGIATRMGEKAATLTKTALSASGEAGALTRLAYRAAPLTAQGIVEGAVFGAGGGVSNLSLSDDPITAESIVAEIGSGALYGATIGGAFGAAGSAFADAGGLVSRRISDLSRKLDSSSDIARKAADLARHDTSKAMSRDMDLALDADIARLKDAREWETRKLAQLRKIEADDLAREKALIEDGLPSQRAAIRQEHKEQLAAIRQANADSQKELKELLKKEQRAIKDRHKAEEVAINSELREVSESFSQEIQSVYDTVKKARSVLGAHIAAGDMTAAAQRSYRNMTEKMHSFEDAFMKRSGKAKRAKFVALDGSDLVKRLRTTGVDESVETLRNLETAAIDAVNAQFGTAHTFDDLLYDSKITKSLVEGIKEDDAYRLSVRNLDDELSGAARDAELRTAELQQRGLAHLSDVANKQKDALAEFDSVMRRGLERIKGQAKNPIDSAELRRIDDALASLKEMKPKKRALKDVEQRADLAIEEARKSGVDLTLIDKVAIANEIGLDLGLIPEGSILDKALMLHGLSRLSGGGGIPSAVSVAAEKTLGKRIVAGSLGAGAAYAGSIFGRTTPGRIIGGKLADAINGRMAGVSTKMSDAASKILGKISSGVDGFISASAKVGPVAGPSAVQVLNAVRFHKRIGEEEDRESLDIQEAFAQRSRELDDAARDMASMQAIVADNIALITSEDPETSRKVMDIALRKVMFLHGKMPKSPALTVLGNGREFKHSLSSIAKFSRYVRAAENPSSVLEDMAKGSVSSESVEAIRELYPEIYSRIQLSLMEKVSSGEMHLTRKQRSQISVLFGVPVDSSSSSSFILAMQRNFASSEQEDPQSRINAGRIRQSIQQQTSTVQRLSQ